ncbi:MAG: hypothetical protein IIT63_06690 [Prevotella sp.]|nr:hypothetical protein [Prevotella sp.]MBQ5455496.1 hypothetical protein [Prevotella sp.]MBQ5506563.1 hypothetical protein [Prevotella sp.]
MTKRILMCLSAWLVAVTCVAVPAKKGFWKAITLKDGTTVQAQLRGDEHLHFWETPDGKRYLVESETGRYIPAIMMMDVNSEGVMVTPSLDPSNPNSQDVQPDDEEYNDEFGAKGASVWD